LVNEEQFQIKLKNIPFEKWKEIRVTRNCYMETKDVNLSFRFLKFFYDISLLKIEFEKSEKEKWNEEWPDDLNNIKIFLAVSFNKEYRLRNCRSVLSIPDVQTYDSLHTDGVPNDNKNLRQIYFKHTFFDLKAATFYFMGQELVN
jgi:hypothetical protein